MKNAIFVAAVTLLVACAGEPTIQSGPGAETSFDGLVKIDNSRFANAWADPDVNFQSYDKILIGNAEFEFRAVKERSNTSSPGRSTQREFRISDENKQKLVDTVTAIFLEELQNSRYFTIVEEAGPDVLIIVGGLHDIVSRVPPDTVGRSEVFLTSVGEATLVLEARDSLSGETLYRATDRSSIEPVGGSVNNPIRSNSVTTWAELRRWARRWAARLVEGLDSVHE